MRTIRIQSILLSAFVFLLTACGKTSNVGTTYSYGGLSQNPNTAMASVSESESLRAGNWSGNGVVLSVTATSASMQVGCGVDSTSGGGSGSFNAPLILDSNHSFQVSGNYFESNSANQAVVYSGTYDSDSQSLTILMSDSGSGQVLDSYTLGYSDSNEISIACQ